MSRLAAALPLVLALILLPLSARADLVAHWPLDENSGLTAAEVVNSNDGTLSGYAGDDSQWQAGQVGGALRFDGSNDFVSHGFELPRSAGSVVLWARPESASQGILVYESDFPNTSADYDCFNSGGAVLERCMLWNVDEFCQVFEDEANDGDASAVGCGDPGVATLGAWNHVAMTWDTSGEQVLYVNCERVSDQDLFDLTFADKSSTQRYFGRPSDNARFFNGLLDDIRVYNTQLTEQEVAALHGNCPSDEPGPDEEPGDDAVEIPALGPAGLGVLLLMVLLAAAYPLRRRR